VAERGGTNHWRHTSSNALPQRLHVDVTNLADESKIDISILFIFCRKFSTPENIWAGETTCLPAEILHRLHNVGLNFARSTTIDDFRARGLGDPIPLPEL